MSNLPPGVTESMIPGNRPEDIAEERFWEELWDYIATNFPDVDADTWIENDTHTKIIDYVRNKVWMQAFDEGRAEAELARLYENEQETIEGGDSII